MSKKLTLAMIKEEVKKYDEKVKIQLSDDVHTFIYPNFSPSKISEMIKETITDAIRAKEANIDFDQINMAEWGLFNIIKHFCDLGIPSDIKKKVQSYLFLRDSDYFEQILKSFPKESINKVEESLKRVTENMTQLNKLNDTSLGLAVEKVVNEVENDIEEKME